MPIPCGQRSCSRLGLLSYTAPGKTGRVARCVSLGRGSRKWGKPRSDHRGCVESVRRPGNPRFKIVYGRRALRTECRAFLVALRRLAEVFTTGFGVGSYCTTKSRALQHRQVRYVIRARGPAVLAPSTSRIVDGEHGKHDHLPGRDHLPRLATGRMDNLHVMSEPLTRVPLRDCEYGAGHASLN